MIHLSNTWFRILLIVAVLFSVSFPLYKKETNDFELLESGIEEITKKISSDAWSFLSESAEVIKKKLFENEKPVSLSNSERFTENIRTGWQYGLSSIGALDKVLHDSTFNIYHIPSMLIAFLLIIIALEVTVLLFFNKQANILAVISFLGILICLYVFGELNSELEHSVVFGGLIFFSFIQLIVLIVSTFSVKNTSPGQTV